MSPQPTAPGGAPMVPASLASTPARAPQPGEPEIYDERDRLVILTPCFAFQATTLFRDSLDEVLMVAPTARFRLADGSVRSLPVVANAINQPNDSHIDRARNTLIWHALRTPYRNFLWADGDQPFTPQDIARTWSHLMNGVRVLGGSVALKTIVTQFAANLPKGKTVADRDPLTGLLPGRDTGTGWMGFRRDVIDEIIQRWPQFVREQLADSLNDGSAYVEAGGPTVDAVIKTMARLGYSADLAYKSNSNTATKGQILHAVFASGVTFRDGESDWLSEDWMFCHRCLQLGIPIKIDPHIRVKHLGPMLFPPEPEQVVEAALQVTGGTRPPFNPALASRAHEALKALHADITDESITVLHPTRGRPAQALARHRQWLERAENPKSIEYIFGVDEDDKTLPQLAGGSFGHQWVRVPSSQGAVAAINAAAATAKGRILVMAADDCEPPLHWDRQIREALRGQLHLPRLLWVSDGYSDQPVATHPIITRALYEQNGGWFFCPDYPHLFCDTELTERALNRGEVVDGRHIVFRHEHPMFTGAKPDALHQERNSPEAWATGREIFQRRNPNSKHAHLRA